MNQFEDFETSSEEETCLTLETVLLVDTKARQWFTEIQFYKSLKDYFTTSVSCQLDTGATLEPIGECDLQVKYHNTRQTLKFQVVQDKCRPLLSAETCEKLQLMKFNSSLTYTVHQVSDEKLLSEEDPFSKYHDVFTGLTKMSLQYNILLVMFR